MSLMPSEKRFRLIHGGESGQPPAAPADSDGDEYTAALAALTEVLAGPDGAHDADARERAATIAREVMGTDAAHPASNLRQSDVSSSDSEEQDRS
jgi:hypothetical protein